MNHIRKHAKRNKTFSMFVAITAISVLMIIIVVVCLANCSYAESKVPMLTAETLIEHELTETTSVELATEPEPVEPVVVVVKENCKESLGDFLITYYCGCEECCDGYGANRPVVNGHKIVFTATSAIAQEGITIAVDPSIIPYGSTVYIEGVGYRVAQDCGGAIKGNRIDVYVNNHERASEMGKHSSQVYLMTDLELSY